MLPVERVVITSIAVRGHLGPMTVWVSNNSEDDSDNYSSTGNDTRQKSFRNVITLNSDQWTKIFSQTIPSSPHRYKKLDLSHSPIIIQPGQVRGIYVHSSLQSDQAIVYDNYNSRQDYKRNSDATISILPGLSHVSPVPFGRAPVWPGWGDAWRRNRKFVGKIEYGVVYRLWNPYEHLYFGNRFQAITLTIFACQRRKESPISKLPDDCIFYILNMCRWDWAGDNRNGMISNYTKRKMMERLKKNEESKNQSNEEQDHVPPQHPYQPMEVDHRFLHEEMNMYGNTINNILYDQNDHDEIQERSICWSRSSARETIYNLVVILLLTCLLIFAFTSKST